MQTILSRYAINERAKAMMQSLKPDEELVLQLRFGAAQRIRTQGEVAQLLGRSAAAVQQIEQQALRKLRLVALGPVSDGWEGWDEA
jgi:DNA-directed RNA polymerase sigma subunit (sigma70/sigma32)